MSFIGIQNDQFDIISTSYIVDHISIQDFLSDMHYEKIILTCPTDSIDVEKKIILPTCIECGICWVKYPSFIQKKENHRSFNKFQEYLIKNKMFTYKWLGLCLINKTGINIKCKGFSRVKRIPLAIIEDRNLYLVKAVQYLKDINEADYYLDDLIQLTNKEVISYKIIKIIIVINDNFETKFEEGLAIISLYTLYNKIINENHKCIKEILI